MATTKLKVLANLSATFIAPDGQEYDPVWGTFSKTADLASIGSVTVPLENVYAIIIQPTPPKPKPSTHYHVFENDENQDLRRSPRQQLKYGIDYYGINDFHFNLNGQYTGAMYDKDNKPCVS